MTRKGEGRHGMGDTSAGRSGVKWTTLLYFGRTITICCLHSEERGVGRFILLDPGSFWQPLDRVDLHA